MGKSPKQLKALTQTPSPVDYNANYNIKHVNGPTIKFPESKRMAEGGKAVPGPGSYKIPTNHSKGMTIPQS